MDSKVKLNIERAENELRLAKAVFNLSGNEESKINLGANPDDTFYSSAISHSYYSIFYSARALLFAKNIEIPEQGQHQAVYFKFKKLAAEGVIEKALLDIYENAKEKAAALLGIFESEKAKRNHFTYKTIAQANIDPAKESIEGSVSFLSGIKEMLKNEL